MFLSKSIAALLTIVAFSLSAVAADFEFEWISNETHQGQETATPVEPLKVNILTSCAK
ncbi:MAG: hypothetical protein OXU51_06090 [Candidatus Poribacteria bacterium]|nr:hypothetical protein [Candidatus Poribacteria bacterium]